MRTMTTLAMLLALPACTGALDTEPTLTFTLTGGTVATGLATGTAASDTDADTDDSSGETPTTPSNPLPTPAFTIGSTPGGEIALSEEGFRTYIYEGDEYWSALSLSLTEEGADESCLVLIRPELAEWGYASPSSRRFETLVIDIGQSLILYEECGWDLDYVQAEFAARGTIEIGLAQAHYADERPYLDVYWDRSWGMPGGVSSTVYSGTGLGFELTDDGVLDPYAPVFETPAGVLEPGFYMF